MTARAPNYRLKEPHAVTVGQDSITMPWGSWVRPVERQWLPKHVLDYPQFHWFDDIKSVACYTKYGFFPIPRDKLEAI